MKRVYPLLLLTYVFSALLFFTSNSQPAISWQDTYGGSNSDWDSKVISTSDDGLLIFGSSNSDDKDVSSNHGFYDFWVVRTDYSGNIFWENNYGGSKNDYAKCAVETSDGGYIIAGSTESNDSDLTQNKGLTDIWIIKISSIGDLDWQFSFGGSGKEEAIDIKAVSDGNFIVLGSTTSSDSDITQNNGLSDFLLIKIDGAGNVLWQKTYGGSADEFASAVEETVDNGFIIAGSASSFDGDIESHYGLAGDSDYFILKTDNQGTKQWVKNYGGNYTDMLNQLIKTPDGGYMLCGFSNSDNGGVSGNHGNYDAWVIKISQTGGIQWQKSIGGSDEDVAKSITIDENGDYLLCGTTFSNDGQVSGNHGYQDMWAVKLNNSGPVIWQRCFGGTGVEEASSVLLLSDQSCIISGFSNSSDGDLNGSNGNFDYWLMKLPDLSSLDDYAFTNALQFDIYPNPSVTGKISIRTNNSVSDDIYTEIISTDGSVIVSKYFGRNSEVFIDVSEFPKGLFLLRLTCNNDSYSRNFIVQ